MKEIIEHQPQWNDRKPTSVILNLNVEKVAQLANYQVWYKKFSIIT